MYSKGFLFYKYISFWLKASSRRGHGIHSPFVFDFIQKILRDVGPGDPAFNNIESKRKELLSSDQAIEVLDLGAGSAAGNHKHRKLHSIAKNAAKSARFGRLFFRLISHYQIDSVLELGTSLGLTTRYFSIALRSGTVISIEGSPVIADLVQRSLISEGYSNVQIIQGNFDDHLIESFEQLKGKRLIFFDGNHRYEPTIRYFKQVLSLCEENDVLIFDDIHWSAEMESAWLEIKNSEKVALTIDLFFIGLVFFKKDFKEKLDFMIRF